MWKNPITGKKFKRIKKRDGAFIAIGFFILISILVNRSISSSFKDKTVEQKNEESIALPAASVKLNPEDPAKYGIIAKKEDRIPQNQGDWDAVVKRSFSHSDKLRHIKDDEFFAGIRKTPKEIEDKIRYLNDRIKRYEKIRRENPADSDAEERLQSLYMLKSTLTFLQDKISISPKNP